LILAKPERKSPKVIRAISAEYLELIQKLTKTVNPPSMSGGIVFTERPAGSARNPVA
jgi:hypothetical protein